jgi:hypothetical protein
MGGQYQIMLSSPALRALLLANIFENALRMFTINPSRAVPALEGDARGRFSCRRPLHASEILMGPTKFTGAPAKVPLNRVGFGGICMSAGKKAISGIAPACLRRGILPVLVVAIICSLSTLGGSRATAQEGGGSDATSSRAAHDDAVRSLPWKQMSPASRQTAQSIINSATIYRHLPTRVIDCDPDLFTFLLQHPEIVIDVWRVMGISQVALTKAPDGVYHGTDGAGTVGTVRYLFSNWGANAQNLAVVYADGAYSGAPFPTPLKAQSVMLVRSSDVQETNGRHYVTVRIDSFVRVEQLGVELVAKTVQPWINKTADQNVIETLTFVSNFSRTAEKNPAGMQRLACRLNSVDEPTRNALVSLCFRTAERYAQRDTISRTGAILANSGELVVDGR